MARTLVPDRHLTQTLGVDEDGMTVDLWRTEWTLAGELVDATPWARSPRQAIGDGIDRDRGYRQVLVRAA